jgi:hypothetical protein
MGIYEYSPECCKKFMELKCSDGFQSGVLYYQCNKCGKVLKK